MNTKDIKQVKAGNIEIQRIMSGGGYPLAKTL